MVSDVKMFHWRVGRKTYICSGAVDVAEMQGGGVRSASTQTSFRRQPACCVELRQKVGWMEFSTNSVALSLMRLWSVFAWIVCADAKIARSRQEDANASVIVAPHAEASTRSNSNYLLMSSPRAAWIRGLNAFPGGDLTDRQLVARERHQWKRCIGEPMSAG